MITAGTGAGDTLSRECDAAAPRPARGLGILALVALMYLVVSGGAYGLEDAVHIAGARLTLLLCLIVPLTLSLPTALMAAELTALMPLEGGFYYWVREALGPFAAFVEAYLTLLYTATDMAIYPVLIAAYLSFVFPLGSATQIILGIALVWLSGALNILGVRPVGNTSIVLMGAVLAPFTAMVIIGFPRIVHWHLPAPSMNHGSLLGALGGGLTVVIWNFSGWENLSVVAGEIENPRRNYRRALAFALPLVAIGYLLPLAVSLSGATSTAEWRVGYFVEVGRRLGGPMLALALAVGGALSAFSIFDAAMLWVSRMPYVLAREGYLPPRLARVWTAHATPATSSVTNSAAPIVASSAAPMIAPFATGQTPSGGGPPGDIDVLGGSPATSIIACCAVFTVLVPLGFIALVVLDVFFYMGALMLEMWALVRLRKSHPARADLFVIGGGRVALIAVVVAPIVTWMATFGLALANNGGAFALLVSIGFALCSWPAYALLRRRYGGPQLSSSSV
ncbi:MAG: hypothetical protein QOK03_2798 [Candidatus Binataceae bacterium]|nr:hypothetical protein [Candidatus Binataceae bacterium]